MQEFWPYPYVSHLLLLPPETAEVSFDLMCLGGAVDGPPNGTSGLPVLPVPSGRLEFGPPDPAIERRRGYRPRRALRGTLRPAGWWWRGIAVDLELLAWSATKSELAMIAGPARRLRRLGERRYLRLAHDVLDALVEVLEVAGDWEDHDLRQRGAPSAKAGIPPGRPVKVLASASRREVSTGAHRVGAKSGGGCGRGR